MLSNPILKDIRNFFSYIFVWVIITAAYILMLIYGEKISLEIAFADGLIFNILLAGFGLSYWYSAKYISFESSSMLKILISHMIGGVISVSLWLALGFFITNFLTSSTEEYSTFFINNFGWRFLVGLLFYFLIIAFYYLIIYYTNFQDKSLRENELKNLVTQAELKNLKFQINPHFIFNSLNSMSALTTIDPAKARSMILKLAEFLRYTLVNNDRQKHKLSEELNNIKLYLEIEKIRFKDKFEYVEEIDPGCLTVEVPNMILQPIFENAIKHAVYETFETVTLKLTCTCENEYMKITLSNNFEEETKPKKGAGIGLKNINNRLELIYGQKELMKVEKEQNNFR